MSHFLLTSPSPGVISNMSLITLKAHAKMDGDISELNPTILTSFHSPFVSKILCRKFLSKTSGRNKSTSKTRAASSGLLIDANSLGDMRDAVGEKRGSADNSCISYLVWRVSGVTASAVGSGLQKELTQDMNAAVLSVSGIVGSSIGVMTPGGNWDPMIGLGGSGEYVSVRLVSLPPILTVHEECTQVTIEDGAHPRVELSNV